MKKLLSLLLAFLMLIASALPCFAQGQTDYITVTDYLDADCGKDVSAEIQAVIDANPNRTIYFPDGEYLLSSPIKTPADPRKSVDLHLSNYAVLRAADDFEGEYLVLLGGKDPFNDVTTPGSNYSLTGGIVDCMGFAGGVSVESGRETKITDLSVKNAVVGIHIAYGANSGSSDADIFNTNITGNREGNSVGYLIEGYDNTITNSRIDYVNDGMVIRSSGNSFTNIHPLFAGKWEEYDHSCGFIDEGGNNLFTYCYSDQFCTAFKLKGNIRDVFDNCFCFWWTGQGKICSAFSTDGKFNSIVTNMRADFRHDTDNTMLEAKLGGKGYFDNLAVNSKNLNGNITYRFYLENSFAHKLYGFWERLEALFNLIALPFRKLSE